MRSIRSWLWAVAAASSLFAGGAAAQVTHRAYLDLDSNPATGCSVATPAGNVVGIEARLTATVSGQPPMVTAVTRENCLGAAFGAPQSQPAGYPVGVNIGTGGADVVEFSTSLTGLGSGGPANITFVSQTATGADIAVATGVFLPGQAAAPTQPAIIPATGILALLLLAALVLWLVRKHPGFGASMALLLLLGAGVAWAANFVTDGQIGDWVGVSPRATDANNDATSGEMTIEIVAVFAEAEGGNLFLRVDVRDAQNQPPVANTPAAATLNEDGTTTFTLTGSDPEGAPLTFAIATPPTRGTLGPITPVNATTATVVYTATANQNGADSFTFTVNDGSSNSTPATAAITITAVNDAPVVTPATFAVVENSPNGTVVGTVSGTDVDTGQTLTWSITAGNTGNAFTINAASGQITVATSAAVVPGPAFSLTVQATDNGAPVLSGSATITINVTGVNDAPSFTAGPNQTATEDDPAVSTPWATAISAGPPDEAGQTLTFMVSNNNNALFSVQPAIAANGTLSYTLAPNANGTATVSVFLQDNGGTASGGVDVSPTVTFTITVAAVNDAPSFAVGPNQTAFQTDGPLTITPWATAISAGPPDESAQTVVFAVTNNDMPALFTTGPAVSPTGVLTFDPAPGQVGVATITLTLSDNGVPVATSAPQVFTITITDVNDAPSFTVPANAPAVNEDAGPVTVPGFASALNDNDPGTQVLTFNVTNNSNPTLFAAGPALSGTTGDLTYTPAANANGMASITVTLSDDGGTANGGVDTSGPQTFSITVNAVNDAPSFTLPAAPNQSVPQDSPAQSVPGYATAILAGPPDESTQTLNFILVNDANALFTVQPAIDPASGTLSYTPAPGQVGTANVTVTLQDNGGGTDTSAPQFFSIALVDINEAPLPSAAPASPITVPENTALGTVVTTISPNDPDVGQTHSYAFQSGNTGNAFAISAGGVISVNGPLDFEGTDHPYTLVVRVTDNGVPVLFADLAITVNLSDVNEAPTINSTAPATAMEDALYTYNATRTDPDGPGQTWSLDGSNTCAGAAIVPATGVYTFTPAGPTPPASCNVGIQVCDGGAPDLCDTQTSTVAINSTNSAPDITSTAPATATEDVLYSYNPTFSDLDGPGQTWSLLGTHTCGGAIVPATGAFSFTPAGPVPPASCTVALQICDGGAPDLCDSETVLVTITAVNDAPSFTSAAPTTATEDLLYSYNPTISDPDGPGQVWTLAAGHTCGGSIAPGTGAFSFTPAGPAPPASCDVSLQVCDTGTPNECTVQTATVTITPVNSAPSIDSTAPATATEDVLYTYNATRTDPDGPGQTWSLTAANTCAGAAIVPATGVYSFTPAGPTPPASCDVGIQVCDGGAPDLCDTQTATVTITAVNGAPTFTSTAPTTATEDTLYSYNPTFSDADGPGQTWSLAAGHTCGGSIVPATGAFSFTPAGPAPAASCDVSIRICDGGTPDQCTDQTTTVTITAVNDAPSVTAPGAQGVDEDVNLVFSAGNGNPISVADPDAGAGAVQITLAATNGVLTTNGVVGLSFTTGDGTADPTLVFTGTLAAANTALNGLIFRGNLNYFGPASLAVTINDQGNTGTGGALSAAANVAITVNAVNDPPLAGDEAFQTYGNTELRLDLAAAGTPHVLDTTGSATGVRHNDMDPVEGHATSVVGIVGCADVTAPFTCTLASGAVVVMESDGRFSYTPGPADLSDTFQYTLQDAPPVGEGSPAQDVGQVTLTMVEMVWYVNASAAPGGNGTSIAPLQNFTGINGAGGAGDSDDADDWIYVHNSAVSGGIELEAGQRLLGEAVALNLGTAVNGDPLVDLRAAGTRPTVNNAAGNAVSIGNALPREVRGLSLQGSANAIDLSTTAALTGATALLIDNNVINGAGAEGIDVNFNTTTTGHTITISNNSWNNAGTHTGNAIDVTNTNATAGTLRLSLNGNTNIESAASAILVVGGAAVGPTVIESLANNTVHGDTGLFGMNFQRVIFDATTAAGFATVAGGTTDIGTAANRVGTSGLRLEDVRGDLSFNSLDIFSNNGTGLFVTSTGAFNAGAGTGFRLVNASTIDSLVNNGGPGVNITNATITLNPATYTVTGSSTFGLNLDTVAGTFSAAVGSSIASPTAAGGTAFRINASSVNSTYNGTINATQGTGVSLTTNTGTMAFTGALTLSTGTNPAFAATGGGSVTSTSATSTLTTSTATALNVANTTIGAAGLVFQSISSNGAASGIILNTTGASGALTVSGTGGTCTAATPTCTGGSILGSTGPGINLTSTRNVSLTRMRVGTGGDDGIRASGLVNFTFATGVVTNNGNAVTERGMELTNLTGTASITDSHVSGNAEDNIYVLNTSGTLSPLTISGTGGVGSTCQITDTSTTVGNDGVHINGQGTAAIVGTISGCRFDGNRGDHIQVVTDAVASGTDLDVVMTNNVMTADGGVTIPAGCTVGVNCGTDLGGSITISPSGNAVVDFDVVGHNIQGAVSSPVTVNLGTTSTSTAALRGIVSGTTIGTAGSVDSGSSQADGINVATNRAGTTTVSLTGNTVRQYANLAGVNLAARDNMGTTTGALNVTMTGNTIANPGTFASNGMTMSSGATAGDNYEVCLDVGGAGALANQVNGSGAGGGTDLRPRHRFEATVRMPGYAGAQADVTAVANYLIARNNTAPTASAAINTTAPFGGQYQNTAPAGSACSQP